MLAKWRGREWNPFKEMEEMTNRMGSLFDRYFGLMPLRGNGDREELLTPTEWFPPVDITEDKSEYVIKAELPEVKKDELHVDVENGVLTMKGERKFEKEEKGKKYHRVERSYGTFVRSFTLPEDADSSKVNAEFKEGVLHVRIAKTEQAKPKAIEVKVS
jgi:HSP20 family protein